MSIRMGEGLVWLVRVVVRHAEIGAEIGIVRLELDGFAVPLHSILVALGIEVHVAELDARLRVGRLTFSHRLVSSHLVLVEQRRRGSR